MYIKKYIKPYNQDDIIDNQEIEAKIDVAYWSQGSHQYYFYKMTFNNLKENDVLKTLKIYYCSTIENKEQFNVYKPNAININNFNNILNTITSIENNQIQAILKNIKPYRKEETTILELDLSNAGYEISPTNNEIVFVIDASLHTVMNSALMNSSENELQIYAEVANFQGINKTSKIDVYPVDDSTKVIVNNNDRKVYYIIDLIKTLGKHCPISLTLVGSNDSSFTNNNFYTKMKWSFQNTIEQFNENNIKDIYVTDVFNKKERYYFVKDVTKNKYKDIIINHEGDSGEVYFNDNNGNYLYFEEVGNIQKFKIYDKYGNYAYYENSSGNTCLKETCNELGIKTTYLWDETFLMEVSNSEGVLRLQSESSTDYLAYVKYANNEVRVDFDYSSFENNKKVVILKTLKDTVVKIINLYYDSGLKISKIGESLSRNHVCLEYLDTKIQKVYNMKEVLVPIEGSGGIAPIYMTQNIKLSEYIYTKEDRYTKFETYTGQTVNTYYDDLGRKKLEIDQDKRMISYDYIGNSEYQSSNSILQTNEENMLMEDNFTNNTLIGEYQKWNIHYHDPSLAAIDINNTYEITDVETTEFREFIGDEALLIHGDNDTPVILSQKIDKNVKHGDQFLLNMFIMKEYLYSYGSYAYVCFFNTNSDYKIYQFNIDTNSSKWEVLTKVIVAEDNYEKIYVGVVIKGVSAFYIDNIKLTQLASGNRYTYDSRNNIVEILGANNEVTKINYDTSNKISYLSLPNNTSYHYFYDTKGRMIEAKDNKGNIITLTYSGNNLVEQTLTNKKTSITTVQTYDKLNNPKQYIDEYNISSQLVYDSLNRLRQEILPSGISYIYTYNKTNDLVEIKAGNYIHSYTYENDNQIKEVLSSNGSKYKFTYDKFGNLLKVQYNDIILNSFTYNEKANNLPLSLITTSQRNVQDPYTFTYDNKQRLTTIKLNNQPIAIYDYDNRGNIIESYDYINDNNINYLYDINNRLIEILTYRNKTNYYYDDQNNIQKITFNDKNGFHSVEYDYDYERNKYTLEHYSQKFINKYNQDVVIGGKEGLGTNGLEPLENTSVNDVYNQLLSFKKKNQYIKYDLSTANKNLKVINKLANGFSYTEWKNSSLTSTSICLWFKPTGTLNETSLLKINNKIGAKILEIKIDENGRLDITPNTIFNIFDRTKIDSIILNEWNLLTINLSFNIDIYLNGTKQNSIIYAGTINLIKELIEQYLTIGGSNDETSNNLEMPFDVSLLSVGPYIQPEDIKNIYYEGLKILNNNPGVLSTTKTRYLPSNFSKNYEVYTLNGVYESNKNNRVDITYKKDVLPFEYDIDTNEIVYSTYQYKESSLRTFPTLGNKGLVSIKFKLENKEINKLKQSDLNTFYNQEKRYILNQKDFSVYVENLILKVEKNGTIICTTSVSENEWYTFTLFIGTTSDNISAVYLNNLLISQFELSHTFDKKSFMYIGTNNIKDGKALDGYLKELIMSDIAVSITNRATIQSKFILGQIEHIKNYDELGRVVEKRAKYKSNVLHNKYTYNKTRLVQERILNKTINYNYDIFGNIVKIIENGVEVKGYAYDIIGRLIGVVEPNGNYNYTYDVDGNIKKVVYTPTSGTALYNVYTYDTTNKDILIHMVNEIIGKEYTFEYPLDSKGKITSMNPISIDRNGVTMPITYEGNRIIQIGTTNSNLESIYQYDDLGRRVRKVCPVYDEEGNYLTRETHEYAYDGENLIYEKITPLVVKSPYTVPCELYYQYDENGELIGVEFRNKNYFYVRDALGRIKNIVDENNTVMVNYNYDEWGVVSVSHLVNNNIGYINSFIYKGYYYDKDQEMYWLRSRFYDPMVKRFLTVDDIQYLPLDSLGNFNLYSYCNSNPVNYKQRPVSSVGSITIPSISSGGFTGNKISVNAVKQIAKTLSSKSSGFNLFGYELRTSAGWDTSPDIATSFFGRIGFSSYVTHTQGQSGMLYAFAGSTSDVMNWFGTTYYAGVGINLFDILGVEAYLETVGIGAQVSIGNFSIGANINLIGGTSITFGWDTDLGNGMTKTDGFTVGVNTGCLVAVIYWIYKFVTTGDPSPVPGLQPA